MLFWLLVGAYWLHLLATVVWFGGIAIFALIAWPALRRGTLAHNQWWQLQQRFLPWTNGALVVLLVTGFVQMTNDANYEGFLVVNTLWSQAILIKHIVFLGMVGIGGYLQGWLYPAMGRLALMAGRETPVDAARAARFQRREIQLLRLNLICAALVLLFTAVATAV